METRVMLSVVAPCHALEVVDIAASCIAASVVDNVLLGEKSVRLFIDDAMNFEPFTPQSDTAIAVALVPFDSGPEQTISGRDGLGQNTGGQSRLRQWVKRHATSDLTIVAAAKTITHDRVIAFSKAAKHIGGSFNGLAP